MVCFIIFIIFSSSSPRRTHFCYCKSSPWQLLRVSVLFKSLFHFNFFSSHCLWDAWNRIEQIKWNRCKNHFSFLLFSVSHTPLFIYSYKIEPIKWNRCHFASCFGSDWNYHYKSWLCIGVRGFCILRSPGHCCYITNHSSKFLQVKFDWS